MIAESSLSTLRISIADMVNLRVRATGPEHDALPEFLYQGLPPEAMSIMGTIPRGTFAVSIPHQSILGCGYEIVRTPPQGDSFVIVYARQPNSRYEAVSVLSRDRELGMEQFHEEARRWMNAQKGYLKAVTGRYVYLTPARNHWEIILRDNGYAVLDASKLPNAITQELRDYAKNQGGEILLRIPVYAGQKPPKDATLPVFAQVELTLDPNPNSRSRWIGYKEYQEERALRSLPPASIVSDFLKWIDHLKTESGFARWTFRPGMLFGDRMEWWGDRNRRRSEHQGIDFAEGLNAEGGIQGIPDQTPVYALADGEVVAVLDDFLGKSVVMRHPAIKNESGDVFYTFLSHIRPVADQLGSIAKGQIIGKVCKSTNSRVPAHLHLTGAWIPQSIHPAAITLDHIHPANTSVILINFNDLISNSPLCVSSVNNSA